MLISPAYAQTAAGGGFDFQALLPLVLIFAVFYFLLIRPQQKKAKQHREMLSAVRRGDKVVTGGGIIATVVKAGDGEEITVEIAKDVRVQVLKLTLGNVLSRSEPAGEGSETGGSGAKAKGRSLLGKKGSDADGTPDDKTKA